MVTKGQWGADSHTNDSLHAQKLLSTESEAKFIEVPAVPMSDADLILKAWQKQEGRSLTTEQEKIFYTAFEKCPYPLYLRLAFDESRRWKSYSKPDETTLANGVREIINALFDRVERLHGKVRSRE